MADITVQELKSRLDKGEKVILIDVREPYEYQAGNLGGQLIPLGSLPQQLEELEAYKNLEVVLLCRTGGRSGAATALLRQQGFVNARNLVGGIAAWRDQVDPSLTVA